MELHFSAEGLTPDNNAFTAVFVHRESYMELLKQAEMLFHLQLLCKTPSIPLVKNSYMLISKHRQQPDSTCKNIGLKVNMKVTDLIYNELGILVALVYLKKNFTCNHVAHIILAKKPNISNSMINLILNGELAESSATISHLESIKDTLVVHGRIGVMTGNTEECPPVDRKKDRGLTVEYTGDYVRRPETTITIENPPPSSAITEVMKDHSRFVTFDQFREQMKKGAEEKLRITLDGAAPISTSSTAEGETYRGYPVSRGPRGGKYYLKDGKKFYLKDDVPLDSSEPSNQSGPASAPTTTAAPAQSDGVVYKINMLA